MNRSLLLAVCLLSFTCLKAQSYTSGRITAVVAPAMSHDSTTCESTCVNVYGITIDSSYIGDSVKVVDTVTATLVYAAANTTGANPWVLSVHIPMYYGGTLTDWQIYGGAANFNGPVIKIISDYDTDAYIPNNFVLPVPNPCIYSSLSGSVYVDNNSNCIFDSGDVPLNGITVTAYENLSSVMGYDLVEAPTTATGGYSALNIMQVSWMTNYTVYLPTYYAFIFPYSSCFTPYAPFTTLPQTDINFPLQCTSSVDVQCWAMSPTTVRVLRPFYMWPYVSNTGCDSASGEFKLIIDSRLTYNAGMSIYPADTVNGDTLIWNYNNLTNLSEGAYWNSFFSGIYLIPDSSLVVGDTVCFNGYTNIPATDVDPLNNSFSFCLPVVYSYDPNLKTVSPQGVGPQGYIPQGPDTLTYNLHFQNTGSSYAENINIIDTLDSHINPSSLRVLGTSANMTPQWLAPGVVQFNFNNINLPDSTDNYVASQGEVRFSVALNTGLAPGTQIHNTGYIYFDANPAVVTNTTLNTIDTLTVPTSINKAAINPAIKVYPNPATDVVYVENLSDGQISILNISGAVMIQQTVVNNLTAIDVSALPGGVYILKTVNNANTTTTKFTKY